jgi:predicted molibdopterin-dependent oxidoreductase YjgC
MMRDHGIIRDVTWGEALDRVSKKLLEVKRESGSESLGFLASAKVSNEENYLFMKMARAAFKSNNIDHCARL